MVSFFPSWSHRLLTVDHKVGLHESTGFLAFSSDDDDEDLLSAGIAVDITAMTAKLSKIAETNFIL